MKKRKITIIQVYNGTVTDTVEFRAEHPEYGTIKGTLFSPVANTEEEKQAWTNNRTEFYTRRIKKVAGKVKVVSSDDQAQSIAELAWKLDASQGVIKDRGNQIERLARQNKDLKGITNESLAEIRVMRNEAVSKSTEIERLKLRIKELENSPVVHKDMMIDELKEHAESLAALNKSLTEEKEKFRARALEEADKAQKMHDLLTRIRQVDKNRVDYLDEKLSEIDNERTDN